MEAVMVIRATETHVEYSWLGQERSVGLVAGGSVADLAQSNPIAAAIFDHVRGGGEAPSTVTLTVA